MFTAPFSLPKTAHLFPKRRLYTDPSAQLCRASDCQLLAPLPPRYHSRRRKGTAYLSSESLSPRRKKKSKYKYKRREKRTAEPLAARGRPASAPAPPRPGAKWWRAGARGRVAGAEPEPAGAGRPPFSTRRAADSTGRARRPDGRTDRPTDGRTDRQSAPLSSAQLGPARPRPAPQGARPPPFVAGGAGLGSQLRAAARPRAKMRGNGGDTRSRPASSGGPCLCYGGVGAVRC